MLPTLALPLCWVGFGPVLLPVPLASPSGHPPHLPHYLLPPPRPRPALSCGLVFVPLLQPWQAWKGLPKVVTFTCLPLGSDPVLLLSWLEKQ